MSVIGVHNDWDSCNPSRQSSQGAGLCGVCMNDFWMLLSKKIEDFPKGQGIRPEGNFPRHLRQLKYVAIGGQQIAHVLFSIGKAPDDQMGIKKGGKLLAKHASLPRRPSYIEAGDDSDHFRLWHHRVSRLLEPTRAMLFLA